MSSAPATARAKIIEDIEVPASVSRLVRVRALWEQAKTSQLEIGQLLYEERAERLSVGGRGVIEGFHQWLRDAGVPKTSAYRRIAEYEISIGERREDDKFDKPAKPVPAGTTFEHLDSLEDRKPSTPIFQDKPNAVVLPRIEPSAPSQRPCIIPEYGPALQRLRQFAGEIRVNAQVTHTAGKFSVTVVKTFKTEKDVKNFLRGQR